MSHTTPKNLTESVGNLRDAAKDVCQSAKCAAVKTGDAVKEVAHETAEAAKKAIEKIEDAIK